MRLRTLLRFAWIAGVTLVIVGSLLPGDSRPIRALEAFPLSDKAEHFGAYAVLGFLPMLHERRRLVAILAVALVALGIALEFGQLLSPKRDFEIADMVADTAGVCAGLALAWPPRRRVQRSVSR